MRAGYGRVPRVLMGSPTGVPDDETLSRPDVSGHQRTRVPEPYLVLALQSDRPLEGSCRHFLGKYDEVLVGRGAARECVSDVHDGKRRLTVRVPDRLVSKEHAWFIRAGERWMVEDAGSKNGSVVNGTAQQRAWLEDGDVVEMGHTFLLFREAVGTWKDPPRDLEAEQLRGRVPGLATLNPGLEEDFAKLARVARAQGPVPVLLEGETGTGKEVVARAYHALSGRPGELVAINCGALPETLVETEIFGARKGAFSGANEDRPGLVRTAERGTLFLDEIGELPLTSQVALLRVLQEGEVLPVGATRPVKVDIRVVAATNRDLGAMGEEGTFRRDLLGRLSGLSLHLPPLEDRREDLGLLIAELLRRSAPTDAERLALSIDATRALFRYDWPLNIRELERGLSAAVALCSGRIELEHLPAAIREYQPGAVLAPRPSGRGAPGEARRDIDQAGLIKLLIQYKGNVAQVARALATSRTQVHRLLKRYGISLKDFRS